MLNRRTLLSAAAGLAVVPKRSQAADRIGVMSPFGFTPEFSDLFNAYSGGHFSRQNINATVLATHGAQSIQQLVAGRVQFIRNTAIDLIRAVNTQNLPLIAIGTLTQASAFVVISSAERPIASVEELRGKVVGIQSQVGGASSTYLQLLLVHNKIKPDEVTMQVAGNTPGSFELVKQGRVDCFIGGPDILNVLNGLGEKTVAWSMDRYIKLPSQIYVTTREMAEGNPDLVTRFMRAIRASTHEMLTTPLPAIFERESKDFEMTGLKDMAAAVAAEQAFFPLWTAEGEQNMLRNVPERWTSGVALMREDKLADDRPAEYYYTNRFVDASV
jgi:NitT/TauT family transport system substrate-binding protein